MILESMRLRKKLKPCFYKARRAYFIIRNMMKVSYS